MDIKVIASVLAEVIQDLGSIPSGELYAAVMSKITLDDFNRAISTLAIAGMIMVENHLITWSFGERLGTPKPNCDQT